MPNRETHLVVVRSITYAMKGQKLLERYGYTAYIERLSRPNSQQGCGYGVRVIGPFEGVLRLMELAGIPVAEVQEGER